MYLVRKVRNENRYCVKCGCGIKNCLYRNCETYVSDRKQAEELRDILNENWEPKCVDEDDVDKIYSLSD